MVLVAGLMPEELSDDAAADRLRKVQQHLITQLSQQHPAALFYSNYFRCGWDQKVELPLLQPLMERYVVHVHCMHALGLRGAVCNNDHRMLTIPGCQHSVQPYQSCQVVIACAADVLLRCYNVSRDVACLQVGYAA